MTGAESRASEVSERVPLDELARRLDAAWEERRPIAPLTESDGLASPADAYAIQRRWTEIRTARGERVMGQKIGLTSRAMQEQMGVDEPDYGCLWASRFFPASSGRAELPADVFIQPRAEGELAFLLGRPLGEGEVTAEDVLAATDAVAVSIEVVDSRIESWRIALCDTIADNASYGAFTVGPWSRSLRQSDLQTLRMVIRLNGAPMAEGVGAAALGHPAQAVAWLANKLSEFGVSLAPGDIVLSGSLTKSIPVATGDAFTVDVEEQPPLTAVFG